MDGMSGDFRPRRVLADGTRQPSSGDQRRLEARRDFTPKPVVKPAKKSAPRPADGSDSTKTETPRHPAEETTATADKVTTSETQSDQASGKSERPAAPKPLPKQASPQKSSSRE